MRIYRQIEDEDIETIDNALQEHGFFVYQQELPNLGDITKISNSLCVNTRYERGANYWSSFKDLDSVLKNVVYDDVVYKLYYEQKKCAPRDVCITKETKNNAITRNNYLHFDRMRSLKMMVYLTDVCRNSGPLTVSPGTNKIGSKLRKNFASEKSYEKKKNRINIDYPEIKCSTVSITGQAGTTILFDSDVFHKGGEVSSGKNRMVIRSHWYKDINWQVNS